MNSTARTLQTLIAVAIVVITVSVTQNSRAANWTTDGGGDWHTGTNWDAAVPDAVGATASLTQDLTIGDVNITLNTQDATVGNLTIGDPAATVYNYMISGPNSLEFNDADSISTVTVNAGTDNAISANVVLADTETEINVGSGYQLTLSGNVSGSNRIEKHGLGTLRLTGTNTFGDLYTQASGNQGTIDIGNASALWTGALRIGYGSQITLNNSTGSELTFANNITNGGGSQLLTISGGDIDLAGSIAFNNGQGRLSASTGVTATVSGTLNCTGVKLEGAGNIEFTGTNNGTIVQIGSGGTHVGMATEFGSAQTVFNANTHLYAIGGARTFNNSIGLGGYGDTHYYFDGTNDMIFTSTIVNQIGGSNDSGRFHVADGVSVTFSGVLDGALGGSQNHYDKYDDGLLILSGANTYNYRTHILGGVLRANDGQGLPTSSYLRLEGGILEGNGVFDRSLAGQPGNGVNGANQFRWNGNGGFSAHGGTLTIDIDGATTDNFTWGGTPNFLGNGNTLMLGSAYADNTVTLVDNINLGASPRTVQVADNVSSANDRAIFSGALSGSGDLNKTGAGTLLLNGNSSTYTGTVNVNAGTVGGTGIVGGSITNNAAVAPGASIGTLTVDGNYTQTSGGTLEIELDGYVQGTGYDWLNVGGTAALDGTIDINWLASTEERPQYGTVFNVLTATSIIDNGVAYTGNVDWFNVNIVTLGGEQTLQLVSTIPEPASLALLLFGFGSIVIRRRNR